MYYILFYPSEINNAVTVAKFFHHQGHHRKSAIRRRSKQSNQYAECSPEFTSARH